MDSSEISKRRCLREATTKLVGLEIRRDDKRDGFVPLCTLRMNAKRELPPKESAVFKNILVTKIAQFLQWLEVLWRLSSEKL